MVRELDLNYPPHDENEPEMGCPINAGPNMELEFDPIQVPYYFESDDDEVVICSPRSFAEAREKSRSDRGPIEVFDVGTESQRGRSARLSASGNHHRRAPAKRRTGANRLSISEDSEETKSENAAKHEEMPQLVPQPPAPTFSCPVCMAEIVEETSTKCGHIFCKKCITAAIASQKKCPTCRRKLRVKDTFRIYFPASA